MSVPIAVDAVGAIMGTAAGATAGLVGYTARESRRISRRVPALGEFLDVSGARIHYRDEGSGPPLVIVHGLAGQMRNFSYALLGRLTQKFRVILIDRPGSGYSTVPRGRFPGLLAQAGIVGDFIGRIGLDRPLLVGHSLGRALSLALAMERADLVCGLALIAPLTQVQDHVPEPFKALAIRSPLLRRVIAWTLVAPLSRFVGDEGPRMLFAPNPVPKDFRDGCGAALPLRPHGFFAASSDLVSAYREMPGIVAGYSKLSLPVEILFGRGDAILAPGVHGEGFLKAVPAARLEVIDGGHMIPVSAPDATARWIEAVYSRVGAARRDVPAL